MSVFDLSRRGVSAWALALALTAGAARAGNIFDDDWAGPATPPAGARSAPDAPAPSSPATNATPAAPATAPTAATAPAPDAPDARGSHSPTDADVHAAAAAQAAQQRRDIPGGPALAGLCRMLKEVYGKELADRTSTGRCALARKLLDDSDKSADNPVDQFVMIRGAVDAAREGGSLDLCFAAIDSLQKRYAVDDFALKVDAVQKAVPAKVDPAAAGRNVQCAMAVFQMLESNEEFDEAARVGSVAQRLAATDATLRASVQKRVRQLDEERSACDRIAPSRARLKSSPNDVEANLAVGKYLCLDCGDWEKGLPLLAKGSDASLKSLAVDELAKPAAAEARVGIADGWWKQADRESGRPQAEARVHAEKIYADAVSELTGLARLRIQKRLDEIGARAAAAGSPASPLPPQGQVLNWPMSVKTFAAEGSLLSYNQVPDEFETKYANGIGQVYGEKKTDAFNIGGLMRGYFGKAFTWAVPRDKSLNVRFSIQAKLPAHHEILLYDSDKEYDPADGGRYKGAMLGHVEFDLGPTGDTVVAIQTDPTTGDIDILRDEKSLLDKPFHPDTNRGRLLVFAVDVRDAGAKVDTTFKLTETARPRK